MAYIAEVIRHLDVVAIQEVKRNTAAIRMLQEECLGPDWSLIVSDVQERIYPQVAVAVGTGAVAGMAADKFVSEMEGLTCPERGTT